MMVVRVLPLLVALSGAVMVDKPKHPRQPSKLKVEFDFESMCPYCHDLIANHLRLLVANDELMNRIDLEMRPFGNAMVVPEQRISKGYHFFHPDASYPVIICQHKEQECLGNALQACALDADYKSGLDLIVCMAVEGSKQHGLEMAAYDCMEELKLDMAALKACAQGPKGHELLVRHSQRALSPELNRTFVPWLTVNGKHLEVGDDHDVLTPLCKLMGEPKPYICPGGRDLKASDLHATGPAQMSFESEGLRGLAEQREALVELKEAEPKGTLNEKVCKMEPLSFA
jgi:hypothetical protein